MKVRAVVRFAAAGALAAVLCIAYPAVAAAHCDTMDGPVVKDARRALEKGDVTPVLKWIDKKHEGEVQEAFRRALAVRKMGPEAKELADRFFFETVVRLHRAGEGAPYTGLKSAGADLDPAVAGADKALETGSVDALVKLITEDAAAGLRRRFAEALEKKKHADKSVEAGREFVEAYVDFVHYVEKLHLDAEGKAGHHEESTSGEEEGRRHAD